MKNNIHLARLLKLSAKFYKKNESCFKTQAFGSKNILKIKYYE